MFREILAILRREGLLKQATEETEEMLSKVEIMFRSAMDMVMERKAPEIDIYEMDKDIDRMEEEVRQKVLKHLVVGDRRGDVSAALVLTSAVREIERVGDYSKSIFELVDICPTEFVFEGEKAGVLKDIETQILRIFTLTQEAHREADIEKARSAMEIQWQISKQCDEMLEYLAGKPEIGIECAIIYALLSRYLQRVSSHLKNIAANVVNPFQKAELKPDA